MKSQQIQLSYQGKKYVNWSAEQLLNEGVPEILVNAAIKNMQEKEQVNLRSIAYKSESDPLYIEWQFEVETQNPDADTYKQKWIEKVQQIKLRYPLVELS